MANYLCEAHGLLNDSFPWSFRMYMVSPDSEATVESTWHGSIKSMWNSAPFNALISSTNHFTGTSSSTLNASWKQTTKTTTDEDLPGTGVQSLPYECAHVVTWRTALANKMGHGRWYLPAMTTGALATGGYVLSTTAVTDIVGAVNIAIAAWAGALTPVILHRKTLTTDNVIKGDVPDGVYVQGRRADKRVPARTSLTF